MAITDNDEVTKTPAARPSARTPGLTAPIIFGLAGAWWASSKAKKLGVTNTKRYWITAAISSVVVALATVLVPILMLLAVSASVGSGAVLNNPSAVSPLGNTGNASGSQPTKAPATHVAGDPNPELVTNDPSTVKMYAFRPAKDDLAGPSGAVVWSLKARAQCFFSLNLACLSQLYSTHGPSYDRDFALVSKGNQSNGPENWDATDIVITKQDASHFTAEFTTVNPSPAANADSRAELFGRPLSSLTAT